MSKIVVSAPGKIILHGEHAVVYHKAAIAISIGLRTKVEVNLSEKNKLKIALSVFNTEAEWKLEDLLKLNKIKTNEDNEIIPLTNEYLKSLSDMIPSTGSELINQSLLVFLYLYTAIFKKYKKAYSSFLVSVTSELPIGAGLGSSAAYSVALTTALLAICKKISSKKFPSNENLSLISKWAFQAEKILHGQPSGIDNSICTYGGALLFRNGEIIEKLSSLPPIEIMLINTKISRNTKMLVSDVKKKYQRHEDIIEQLMSAIDSITQNTWNILKECQVQSSQILIAKFQELIVMNHHLLNALGVGHPKLDEIVEFARKHHLAAKLTGAGGGGCAFVLLSVNNNTALPTSFTDCLMESLNTLVGDNQLENIRQDIEQRRDRLHLALGEKGFEYWDAAIGGPGVMFN